MSLDICLRVLSPYGGDVDAEIYEGIRWEYKGMREYEVNMR